MDKHEKIENVGSPNERGKMAWTSMVALWLGKWPERKDYSNERLRKSWAIPNERGQDSLAVDHGRDACRGPSLSSDARYCHMPREESCARGFRKRLKIRNELSMIMKDHGMHTYILVITCIECEYVALDWLCVIGTKWGDFPIRLAVIWYKSVLKKMSGVT